MFRDANEEIACGTAPDFPPDDGGKRFRYSLRRLLAFVTFFAVLLSATRILIPSFRPYGRVADLPPAEQQILRAVAAHGFAVVDHFT
jgi:hypothetical protein